MEIYVKNNKNYDAHFGIKISKGFLYNKVNEYVNQLNYIDKLTEFYYTPYARIKPFDISIFNKKGITIDHTM